MIGNVHKCRKDDLSSTIKDIKRQTGTFGSFMHGLESQSQIQLSQNEKDPELALRDVQNELCERESKFSAELKSLHDKLSAYEEDYKKNG